MRNLESAWKLHIIRCRGGELHVGIALDVAKRVKEHKKGSAGRYTKYRRPVRLIYMEECGNYAEARRIEKEVKRFSREKKLALIGR